MLDPIARTIIDPPLNIVGKMLVKLGLRANQISLIGFIFGLMAMVAISQGQFGAALILVALNRLFDGLDGAVARQHGVTDFGGFLDIVFDLIVYAGLVFSIGLARPEYYPFVAFLLFSFIGPIGSFLAYAIIAEKQQISSKKHGLKAFYYSNGICEGTETAMLLLAMCLWPDLFPFMAVIFGILCWATLLQRVANAWFRFK